MSDLSSLHHILYKTTCKIEDVKACLKRNKSTINEVDEDGDTPLFLALRHSGALIKVLVQNGADVSCRDINSNSLLWNALKNGCEDSVVKVLLEVMNNTCVNEIDFFYEIPPLVLALKENSSTTTIKLLLQFGATVDFRDNQGRTPLSLAIELSSDETIIKLLMKYGLMRRQLNIDLFQENAGYEALASYTAQCAYEIRQMESVEVDGGRTLHQVISEDSFPWLQGDSQGVANDKVLDNFLDNLLKMRVDIIYPIYMDVILIKVSKRQMLEKLQAVLYLVPHVHSCPLRNILLPFGCAFKMTQLLSEEDILRLILAFYIPHN